MRKRFFSIGFIIFIVSSITIACSSNDENSDAEESDSVNLKVAHPLSDSSTVAVEGAEYWMEQVEDSTNGEVTFDYYPSEQLGKAGTMDDLLDNGVADVALITPAYYGDELELTTIIELPGIFDTVEQSSLAYTDLLTENDEFSDFFDELEQVPMWGSNMGPYEVSTLDKKIENVEDFKGLQIRASGNTQEILYNSLDASPTSMSSSDMYTALQRGSIDGISYTISNWEAYSVQEELKHSTTNGFFGTTAVYMVISDKAWDSLSKEVKSAIEEANADTAEHFSQYMDSELDKKIDEFSDEGIEMYELSDDLLDDIYDRIEEPTYSDWKDSIDEKGFDADDIMDEFTQNLEEYSE